MKDILFNILIVGISSPIGKHIVEYLSKEVRDKDICWGVFDKHTKKLRRQLSEFDFMKKCSQNCWIFNGNRKGARNHYAVDIEWTDLEKIVEKTSIVIDISRNKKESMALIKLCISHSTHYVGNLKKLNTKNLKPKQIVLIPNAGAMETMMNMAINDIRNLLSFHKLRRISYLAGQRPFQYAFSKYIFNICKLQKISCFKESLDCIKTPSSVCKKDMFTPRLFTENEQLILLKTFQQPITCTEKMLVTHGYYVLNKNRISTFWVYCLLVLGFLFWVHLYPFFYQRNIGHNSADTLYAPIINTSHSSEYRALDIESNLVVVGGIANFPAHWHTSSKAPYKSAYVVVTTPQKKSHLEVSAITLCSSALALANCQKYTFGICNPFTNNEKELIRRLHYHEFTCSRLIN
ncbi:uncharacterized protein LOC126315428 [Schistocerca gregaria]|uniref:uncharacterized protein LOC126315428 n=1 Tax=Schistocerca gregaria TaxID=7010 RepID=UPI00211E12AE|nr:uncharacterized protein LOC126315428 [Schistocerca gregaria]